MLRDISPLTTDSTAVIPSSSAWLRAKYPPVHGAVKIHLGIIAKEIKAIAGKIGRRQYINNNKVSTYQDRALQGADTEPYNTQHMMTNYKMMRPMKTTAPHAWRRLHEASTIGSASGSLDRFVVG